MTRLAEKLDLIVEQLKKGVQPPDESVRSILSWFNAERRGTSVVASIRKAMDERGITTSPNFEHVWIDATVRFERKPSQEMPGPEHDPTFRIGRLNAANKPVVSVLPTDTIHRAVALMLTNDFSQLPVMSGPRDVKGVVSWKTLGSRLAMNRPCNLAKDFMESAQAISQEESLLDAVEIISKHDYVLVIAGDRSVAGLVTASDFNLQFRVLAEPFLLVGEIEQGIRKMLHGNFTASELQECRDPRNSSGEIAGPNDLTFGEYIRLVQTPSKWEKLGIAIDRVEFVRQLDRVRELRNDVMHFDPDGLDPDDLLFLSNFARFLKRMREIVP